MRSFLQKFVHVSSIRNPQSAIRNLRYRVPRHARRLSQLLRDVIKEQPVDCISLRCAQAHSLARLGGDQRLKTFQRARLDGILVRRLPAARRAQEAAVARRED